MAKVERLACPRWRPVARSADQSVTVTSAKGEARTFAPARGRLMGLLPPRLTRCAGRPSVGGLLVCSRQDRTPLRLASGVVFGPPKPRSVLPRRCAYAPGWSPLPHARPGAPHSLDLRSSTATRRGAAPPHRRTSMAHQDWRGPPNHPASRLADIPQRVRDAFNARRRVGAAGECWPYGNNQTYGNVQWRDDDGTKRRIAAHRLALMLRTGEDVPGVRWSCTVATPRRARTGVTCASATTGKTNSTRSHAGGGSTRRHGTHARGHATRCSPPRRGRDHVTTSDEERKHRGDAGSPNATT